LLGAALLAAGAAAAATRSGILVRYSFDDARIETGPDTFAVFENARGKVALSTAFRTSGFHSVEIREAAGDGDFAELQGYFPVVREGFLYVHFALLVTDPAEELNVALAGPARFRLAKDGIAFWLTTRDGWLAHVSDSITRRLFRLEPFTWYRVDLAYDVERGTYDLAVAEERQLEQRVFLQDQPGAASQRGSAVNTFSFIGDLLDASQVRFYVDDVVIGTDASVERLPFVAPGRRRLFLDVFLQARERMRDRYGCLPALAPDDFGLSAAGARALAEQGTALAAALAGARTPPGMLESPVATDDEAGPLLSALGLWGQGCRALEAGNAEAALTRFERAAVLAPEARIHPISAVLALAAAGRAEEAEERWSRLEGRWRSDPRLPLVWAQLGRARGDLEDADAWLRRAAGPAAGSSGAPAERRIAEEYFHLLLWTGRVAEAEDYAETVIHSGEDTDAPDPLWMERAGDAAVVRGDLRTAMRRYERASGLEPERASLLLKLSDLYYASGDPERERHYRERVYGTLRR
jgi:tetratricopeptide (TPR) repeat protein